MALNIERRDTYNPIPGGAGTGYLPNVPPTPLYMSHRKRRGHRDHQRRVPDVVDMSGYGYAGAYDPLVFYAGGRHNRVRIVRLTCGRRGGSVL
jgi:hypothetical protein